MCFRLSPFPPLSTLSFPPPIVFYFMRLLRQVKAFAAPHFIPHFPFPFFYMCLPGKIHFFVVYGFYDFSISFATSRSTRELYQFARARDLPINSKDDVAMRIRYASIYSYVHCHSNSYSHINYFNCHMSSALYRQRLRLLCGKRANLRCNFCNEVKLVLQSVERNKKTCK